MATLVEAVKTQTTRTKEQEAGSFFDQRSDADIEHLFSKVHAVPKASPIPSHLEIDKNASAIVPSSNTPSSIAMSSTVPSSATSSSIGFGPYSSITCSRDQTRDARTGSLSTVCVEQSELVDNGTKHDPTGTFPSSSALAPYTEHDAATSVSRAKKHHTGIATSQGGSRPARRELRPPEHYKLNDPRPGRNTGGAVPHPRHKLQSLRSADPVSEDVITPLEPNQPVAQASNQRGASKQSGPAKHSQNPSHDPEPKPTVRKISLGKSTLFRMHRNAYISPDLPMSQPVTDLWDNEIQQRLELEIARTVRSTNPRDCIVLHCMMAGKSESQLSPHVVIFCSTDTLRKRITKEVKSYDWIPKKGLQCMIAVEPVSSLSIPFTGAFIGIGVGAFSAIISFLLALVQILYLRREKRNRSNLRSGEVPPTGQKEKTVRGEKREPISTFCGIPFKFTVDVDQMPKCTLGGLVAVGDHVLGLTVAHNWLELSESRLNLEENRANESIEGTTAKPIFIRFDSSFPSFSSGSQVVNCDEPVDRNEDTFQNNDSNGELRVTKSCVCTGSLNEYSHSLDWATIRLDHHGNMPPNLVNVLGISQRIQTIESEADLKRGIVTIAAGFSGVQDGALGECSILEEIKHTYRAPSASIFRDDTVVKDPHSKENPNTPSEQLNVANSNIPDSPKDAAGATEMRGSSTKSFLSRAGLQLAEYDDRLHNSVFERIPKRFRMIAVALSLAIANCLVSMDRTAVVILAPKIADDLQTSFGFGWYLLGPILMETVAPWLSRDEAKYFPARGAYLLSFLFYGAGSLACGLADNIGLMILGRTMSGLGTGGVILLSWPMMAEYFSAHPWWRFNRLYLLGMSLVSWCVGPFVAAALADTFSWRWYFGLNFILAIPVSLAVYLFVPTIPKARERPDDWYASDNVQFFWVLAQVSSFVAVLMLLQTGVIALSWDSAALIAPLIISTMLFLALQSNKIWHLGVYIKAPSRLLALVLLVTGSRAACWITLLYLSLRFQTQENKNGLESAVRLIPFTVAGAVSALLPLLAREAYMVPLFFILGFAPMGAGFLSTASDLTADTDWIGYQIMLGIGTGISFTIFSQIPVSYLPNSDFGDPQVYLQRISSFLIALMLAVAQSLYQTFLASNLSRNLPGFSTSQLLNSGTSAFIKELYNNGTTQAQIAIAANDYAFNIVSYLVFALTVLSAAGGLAIGYFSLYRLR